MGDARDKCIVIGISGLSLELVSTKLREGKLPTLAAMMASGNLRAMVSPVPPHSPAAWASLSAGVGPGVHGFVLNDEQGPSGPRAAGYASWRSAPFWERLDQVGLKTASLCWPGVIPGAAWGGVHVDERLLVASGVTRDDWPLPLDISPAWLREVLRSSRVHPTEIPQALLAPLIPSGGDRSSETEARLAVALARLATFQAALDDALHAGAWELLAAHQSCVTDIAAALDCAAEDLPDAAWALLDQSLALVIGRAPATSLIIIASVAAEGPGFFLGRGPGFEPGRHSHAVSTLDVAPTIFGHFGFASPELGSGLLPPGSTSTQPPPFKPRAASPHPDPRDVARLAEFGHQLDQPDLQRCALRLLAEAELILADEPDRAAALAEEALISDPRSLPALGILATSRVTLGEGDSLPEIARRIDAIEPGHLWAEIVLGAYHALNQDEPAARPHLRRIMQEGNLDERLRAGAIWLMLDRRAEAARIFREILVAHPCNPTALAGLLSTETVRGTEAEQLLRRLLAIDPTHLAAVAALKTLLGSLGRSVEAASLSTGGV